MTLRVVATDLETGETSEATIPDGSYVLLATAPCHLAHEQRYANGTRVLTVKGYREGATADTRTSWSWTPPPEPPPSVRRLRPVERYPGDNDIWIDREPDHTGWRIFIRGRSGGPVEWLQVVAAAGQIYGGRQLVDATAEVSSVDGTEPNRG